RELHPDADRLDIVTITRPSGGASWETFMCDVRVRSGATERDERLVLKRAPETGPLAPYDVAKDVTIFSTLAASDAPVPELRTWTNDRSVFERPFTVTAFVEGESHDITKVERWPVWQSHREALGNEIIDTLAALQRFDWHGTDLPDVLGPRGSAAQRAAQIV